MATAVPLRAQVPAPWLEAQLPALVALYEELHREPELSFHEERSAARLARELAATGAQVTTGVGGHGVVAVLAHGEGPTVLVRTDMDALPVEERTGRPYSSQRPGVMHACGHDLHMTNLVFTARFLAAHQDRWRGRIVFVGQPAEEKVAGLQAMLDDGLLERFPRPDFALALHVSADLPVGVVGWRAGWMMANVDCADIVLHGKGGHGAAPHTTIDPIVQAAQLVVQLQAIVAREVPPTEPAVVTVGSIHGGTKHNIIPDQCRLQLTIRCYDDAIRALLLESIRRKAEAVALAAGAPKPEVTFSEHNPALWNDEALTQRVVARWRKDLGEASIKEVERFMVAEDFALLGRQGIPSLMFRLGTIAPERLAELNEAGGPPSLHSGGYWPDAGPSLAVGVRAMSSAVLELLGR